MRNTPVGAPVQFVSYVSDSPGSRNWSSAGSSEWAGSLWNSECCVTHLARGTGHRLAAASGRGHSGTASAV